MQAPQIISGPAIVTYGGQTFFTTGNITLTFDRATFDINTAQHGRVDSRHESQKITVSFDAIGQASLIDYLIAHTEGRAPGETLIPSLGAVQSFAGANTGEVATASAHGYANGDRVTLPYVSAAAGWSTGVVYYIIGAATNTFQLSLTSGGSAVLLSGDITGTVCKVEETPLVIMPLYNNGGTSKIWTFPRAGITAVGAMKFSGSAPLSAQVTFTALESAAVPGSYYSPAAYSAPSSGLLDDFNAAQVIATALKLVWAGDPEDMGPPDVQMLSRDGWTLTLEMPTKEYKSDGHGIVDVVVGTANTNASVTGEAAAIYDYLGNLVPESSWPTLMDFATPRPGQQGSRQALWLVALYADGATGIAADGAFIKLASAEWTSLGGAWGDLHRSGAVKFACLPRFATGVRTLGYFGQTTISELGA